MTAVTRAHEVGRPVVTAWMAAPYAGVVGADRRRPVRRARRAGGELFINARDLTEPERYLDNVYVPADSLGSAGSQRRRAVPRTRAAAPPSWPPRSTSIATRPNSGFSGLPRSCRQPGDRSVDGARQRGHGVLQPPANQPRARRSAEFTSTTCSRALRHRRGGGRRLPRATVGDGAGYLFERHFVTPWLADLWRILRRIDGVPAAHARSEADTVLFTPIRNLFHEANELLTPSGATALTTTSI
jgi:hypothetical protein